MRPCMQMQQANLDMLQRGAPGAAGTSVPQMQQPAGSSSPADMFNNLATMYGLPSAQGNAGPGAGGEPADASASMAPGVHFTVPSVEEVLLMLTEPISQIAAIQLPCGPCACRIAISGRPCKQHVGWTGSRAVIEEIE